MNGQGLAGHDAWHCGIVNWQGLVGHDAWHCGIVNEQRLDAVGRCIAL